MPAPVPFAGLPRLDSLFGEDRDRLQRFSAEVAGIYFDWSKTHLTPARVEEFVRRSGEAGLADARDRLFSGGIANPSEGRAATHVAERGSGSAEESDIAAARHARMRALIDAIEAEAFGPVTGILHIGIGGSVLGPALLIDALDHEEAGLKVRFLSNIDGIAFEDSIRDLDPATTLIAAVSKTFTTAETLSNLEAALDWVRSAGISDPYGRVIAITANPDAAIKEGVDETRVLPFGEGVGGRYSLWSAVGFSAALALGWSAFEELLEGAALMDRHFRLAPIEQNLPVLAAFADRLYVEQAGCQARGVFAYDERLRLLVDYLQQLEMESNGKSVTVSGEAVGGPTAPVTWGGVGTDAQHAVFQLLHQGTVPVPVEFVAVREQSDHLDPEHHRLLLLNAFAQGAALMNGQTNGDPQRAYPGNRPSTTILLERLDALTLGALIAFYEHRTFTNAVLAGINPFDQFGVELGKSIARRLADGETGDLDPSTEALIGRIEG